MTAYRYVRTGKLEAVSVGGRWWVDPEEVAALATGSAPRVRVPGGSRTKAAVQLERRLVEGDEAGAFAVCEEALSSWATPVELHLELFVPALRRIGERWEHGDLTVADEHRATAVAARVIGRLGPRFVHRGRRRGSVVVGSPAGDRHGIPVMVVGDLLRNRGFTVTDLGADTPAQSFVDAARRSDRLRAVAIGVTLAGNESAAAAAVQAIHDELPGVPVVVGGAGITDQAAADRIGADHWSSSDGGGLVELVERVLG